MSLVIETEDEIMTTESEMMFQSLSEAKGVSFQRIECEADKTPDYCIDIAGTRIVIEIKQFDADSDEDGILQNRSEQLGKIRTFPLTPGDAVRRKIKKAGPQIKMKTGGTLPSMLILYNRRLLYNPANDYEIRVGMYGFDSIVFAVPDYMSVAPYEVDRKFGGSRKMTETCNTSISAVGVLGHDEAGGTQLMVYHNYYAVNPLCPDYLRILASRQFILETKKNGQVQSWQEVK